MIRKELNHTTLLAVFVGGLLAVVVAIFCVQAQQGSKLQIAAGRHIDEVKLADLQQSRLDALHLADLSDATLLNLGIRNLHDPRLATTSLSQLRDQYLGRLKVTALRPDVLNQLQIADLTNPGVLKAKQNQEERVNTEVAANSKTEPSAGNRVAPTYFQGHQATHHDVGDKSLGHAEVGSSGLGSSGLGSSGLGSNDTGNNGVNSDGMGNTVDRQLAAAEATEHGREEGRPQHHHRYFRVTHHHRHYVRRRYVTYRIGWPLLIFGDD